MKWIQRTHGQLQAHQPLEILHQLAIPHTPLSSKLLLGWPDKSQKDQLYKEHEQEGLNMGYNSIKDIGCLVGHPLLQYVFEVAGRLGK